MPGFDHQFVATAAIVAIAEIRAAAEAFDRGAVNVHTALDAILVAVDAYRDAMASRREAA